MIRRFARLAMCFAATALWPAAAQNSGPLYVVTTIGGTALGVYAGNGDGGRAMDARISGESLAHDSRGNLYIGERGTVDSADALIIADTDHHRVLRLDPSGAVRIIAGTGAPGSSGDGGPAAAATMTYPFGLSFDRAGNLYIGEYSRGRVPLHCRYRQPPHSQSRG